jgi:16S rRNA (guanine966-N2)-methyltransferase
MRVSDYRLLFIPYDMPHKTMKREIPGSVRIVAGQWRGRRVAVPRGTYARPTTDRIRETLFNWLSPVIAGARCLDLYAGCGALGLEALSRRASEVAFVERDARLARGIREFLQAVGDSGQGRVFQTTSAEYLMSHELERFDIVFIDPPYDEPLGPILERIRDIVAPRGYFYTERPARVGLPEVDWATWQRRGRAGAVAFGLASPMRSST